MLTRRTICHWTAGASLRLFVPCFLSFVVAMAQSTECLDVFILGGQSNMAGRGGVDVLENGTRAWNQVVPMSANVSDGSILRLTAQLNWEPAKEPLHRDIDAGEISHTHK